MAYIRMIQIEANYVGTPYLYLLERIWDTRNDFDMLNCPPFEDERDILSGSPPREMTDFY